MRAHAASELTTNTAIEKVSGETWPNNATPATTAATLRLRPSRIWLAQSKLDEAFMSL